MSTMLAAVAAHGPGWAGPGWAGPGWWAGPGFGGGWWFLLVPLLVLIVVLVVFAVFGRRWRRAAAENGYGPFGRVSPQRQAETTLAERFARGDIDESEYRTRLAVLRAPA